MSADRTQVRRMPTGGCIDRERTLTFSFDGRLLSGHPGDTLASALLANGIDVVGRSFKYHRPRGIVGAGPEEPNAIVQVGRGRATDPGVRATQLELYDGLVARSVRGWPSLRFDLMAINDRVGSLLGAGFYYKTFKWPRRLWPLAERAIRRTTGMGRAPNDADPDAYRHRNAHCDVLVAGGGPAGLMAALTAARAGARVIIADDHGTFGGRLLCARERIDGLDGAAWAAACIDELSALPGVTVLPNSTVFGYHDGNFLTILERREPHLSPARRERVRQRQWRVRARRVVLAQGAFERPIVFPGNDIPGVMTGSAVSTYINRYAVRPGSRAVVFTNNDSGYDAAVDLIDAGVAIAALVDAREAVSEARQRPLRRAGVSLITGAAVTQAFGRRRVHAVTVRMLEADGRRCTGNAQRIDCDLVAVSGGWNPAVHLHSQAGGTNAWDDARHCFVPAQSVQPAVSAGAGNGTFDLAGCLREGLQAGRDAALECGFDVPPAAAPETDPVEPAPLRPLWRVPVPDPDGGPRQFVDLQNDVTLADIRLAVREGYESIEHIKRYTTLGFGTDQGKLGNINGMALAAEALGRTIPEVGTTTFRPAYTPVPFGAVAGADVGALFDPVRKTALHGWHERAGAVFEVVGQWHRPRYYQAGGEDMDAAVARECLAARRSLAIMDASTLGKIEVRGADALTFLQRIYTHDVARLGVGRCAYGIMLGEDGMVMDDGVMARLGEQHYYLTTTTGGAAAVLGWLERWLQTEWPDLNVYLTSVTDHWSTLALVGPRSRDVLASLGGDIDVAAEAFPFMAMRSGTLAGLPARVFRVSFSGELAFEINVDSNDAEAMWTLLMEAGGEHGITPYGTEAMHVLRAEKGFVIVGQETDGSVTPTDLGMHWLLADGKDYLGRRSLARSDCVRPDRKQLVGLLSTDARTVVPEGAQLVLSADSTPPVPLLGHVTSSYFSACLGHPIALALLASGRQRKGERLFAATRTGERIPVEVVSPVFYDPKGERQRA